MIELINLSIDIIILLVKDYHIRLREEQERQEKIKEIRRKVFELNKKLKQDYYYMTRKSILKS